MGGPEGKTSYDAVSEGSRDPGLLVCWPLEKQAQPTARSGHVTDGGDCKRAADVPPQAGAPQLQDQGLGVCFSVFLRRFSNLQEGRHVVPSGCLGLGHFSRRRAYRAWIFFTSPQERQAKQVVARKRDGEFPRTVSRSTAADWYL